MAPEPTNPQPDVLVTATIRVAAHAFTDGAAGQAGSRGPGPPQCLFETVGGWLGCSGCQGPPGAEATIPLVLLAGMLHQWPPAQDRWLAFQAFSVVELRRASGPGR